MGHTGRSEALQRGSGDEEAILVFVFPCRRTSCIVSELPVLRIDVSSAGTIGNSTHSAYYCAIPA